MKILFLVTLLALPLLGHAQDAGQETPFSIGAGARALGMGGGFISLSDDASAIYYNPAGLPSLNYQELSLMHINLFQGTIYNYAGWVYPDTKLGGFGIGYFRIGTDEIVRRSNFASEGTFDYANSQFVLAYGKRLQGGIAIGVSFKVVNQTLDSLSDYGIGIDVGMTADLADHIRAGLIFRDIVPPELELADDPETSPITLAGGLALRELYLSDEYKINAAFELEKIENRTVKVHSGLEIVVSELYALRTGYDRDNFSFGAGFKMNRLKIDYAYKIMDFIDDSHRFSLSMLIGSSISDKLEKEVELQKVRGTELLEDERIRQFEFYKEKADNYHRMFMLDSASAYYQRALAFDENNSEIIGIIAGIENSIKKRQETEQFIQKQQLELNTARVAYLSQAHNFFDKKYYNAALDMLQLILDVSPNYGEAVILKQRVEVAIEKDLAEEFSRADSAMRRGDHLTALNAYNRILEIDPKNNIAKDSLQSIISGINIAQQLNQGIKDFNEDRKRRAKTTFEAVLSIDKNNPVAIEYLKKIDLTVVKPTTLEDLQKNREVWQLYLDGLRFMRNKEYQKAIDAWEKVLKTYPNNINTINNLEQARLRLESEKAE